MKIKGGRFFNLQTNPLSIFIPEEWNEAPDHVKRHEYSVILMKELHSLQKNQMPHGLSVCY